MAQKSPPTDVNAVADQLARSLRALLPKIDAILADDWGANVHARLRDYASTVLADLEARRSTSRDSQELLAHLSALGTDLAMHRTLAHWDLGPDWDLALKETESAALQLSLLLRAAT